MSRNKFTLVALLALSSATAFATEPVRPTGWQRPQDLMIPVKLQPNPNAGPTPRIGPGTIIFMNRNGGTYYGGGWEDSTSNTSSIITGTKSIPAFPYSDLTWQGVMQCMREIYGPFNVEITDVDPGNVPHIESVVTTTPSVAGQPSYTGGVSPWTCGLIDNAIVWTFASVWGDSVRDICETAAQETAHSFALDHEYLCKDPMTYLFGCGDKSFQNVDAQCGENGPRTCSCTGSSTQNSVQMLTDIFGARDNNPPTVHINSPANNATVPQGFPVDVNATDDMSVSKVEFYLDGSLFATDTSFPFSKNAPSSLSNGSHTLMVRAFDNLGLTADTTETVNIQPPCAQDSDCSQDYEVCIDGHCVAGPSVDNGLGDSCSDGSDCFSGICGDDGSGDKHCVEPCDPAASECPSGYDCLAAGGGGGVCWPADGGGNTSGGCAVGTSSRAPMAGLFLAALALGLAFLRRRSRSR